MKAFLGILVLSLGALLTSGCSSLRKSSPTPQPENQIFAPTEQEQEAFEDHAAEEHEGDEDHVYVTAEELAPLAIEELSEQEQADILYMRQEEKMARDVYRTLGETYSINQFRNIPLSEQKHTDAMEVLIERYDLIDPIEDETDIGTYADSGLNELYKELVAQGEQSLTDALTVGATIEDLNMFHLLEVMEHTDNEDLRYVYESVLAQSHHHMQAFYRGLQKEGITYQAQYITPDYLHTVIQ